MKNNLFNSPFEMGLRITLLLASSSHDKFSANRIIGLDFMSCYSADFGLPYPNLHGDNGYRYGEIAGRRMLVQDALKQLVTSGVINVVVDNGYFFSISKTGEKYASTLESDYAMEYRTIAKAAAEKYRDYTDSEILDTIQNMAVRVLKG